VRSWPSRRAATAWRRHRRAGRHPDLGAGGGPAGLSGRGRGADRGWAGRGDRRLASLHRGHGRRLAGLGAQRAVQWRPTQPGLDHQDRQPPARRLLVEAAWHPATPIGPAGNSAPDRTNSPLWSANAPRWATAGCSSAGASWTLGVSAPPSAWSRSPASLPDGAGAWPSWTPNQAFELAGGRHPPARGATRDTPMGSQAASTRRVTLDLSTSGPLPTPTRSCGSQPAHLSLTAPRVRSTPPHRPQPSTLTAQRAAHPPTS
jgi:hypothetical protein